MAKEFQPRDDQQPEIPNENVRKVIDRHKLGFIRHVDFDSSLVCRHKTTGWNNVICSPDSSCVIAHKDAELYRSKSLRNAEEGDNEEGDNEEGEQTPGSLALGEETRRSTGWARIGKHSVRN